jgi:UDP-2,4-diacetamido-2,4,6-trideoxy-beta-L-altropyranose hydrolase
VKVVFRVDASLQIGTGHVMRCLTLAEALKGKNVEVAFICREHKGHLIDFIENKGFNVNRLSENKSNSIETKSGCSKPENTLFHAHWLGATQQQDAEECEAILNKIRPDWLIIDHYAIDQTWQNLLQGSYQKLMVIDDLADRKHQCELLLDQTYGRNSDDYSSLIPKGCQTLLGSQYALLRPEFTQWREYSLKRRTTPKLKKLLITMGGVDSDNVTGQVLNALKTYDLPKELEVTVVMGATAPHIKTIKKQAEVMCYKTEVKTNVNNIAEIMANTDLAIGAAGATTWERCCLGVPSIQIVLAENQTKIAQELSAIHAIEYLKNMKDFTVTLDRLVQDINNITLRASRITDGGGTNRVVKILL